MPQDQISKLNLSTRGGVIRIWKAHFEGEISKIANAGIASVLTAVLGEHVTSSDWINWRASYMEALKRAEALGIDLEETEIQPIPPVTTSEAADYLGVTPKAINTAIHKGKIQADITREPFLIPWSEVLAYKEFQKTSPQSQAGRKQGRYTKRLSIPEAAKVANVSESTVRKWCRNSQILGVRKHKNKFTVPESGLKKFLSKPALD